MNFAEEIRILIDSLTYVEAYGPDEFPEEDGTDFSSEARRIMERFDVVAPRGRGSTRQHWLLLARQELVAGFEGLFAEVFLAAFSVEFLLRGKDRGGVRTTVFDQMMDDASEFVGRGGDGLRRAEAGLHASEVIA
jgi:hypothetical protein